MSKNLNQLAFPSAPKRNGEYCVYCYRNGDSTSCFVFAAPFAAKKFCEAVFQNDLPKRQGNELERDGIMLSCVLMKRIVDHNYTKEEELWQLPAPYPGHAYTVRHGVPEPRRQDEEDSDNRLGDEADLPAESRKKERTPRKKTPAGHQTVQQIAASIKLDPREARQILRKHSKKTDFGWSWPKEEVEAIKKLLAKHRKKK